MSKHHPPRSQARERDDHPRRPGEDPRPNINIVERFVIVDGGFELCSATMEPPPVMVTAVHRRISDR
jgi:hypothetical protein